MRAELMLWAPGDAKVDPGETLLRLLSQSWARVRLYSDLLAKAYEGAEDFPEAFAGAGVRALIGHKYDLTKDGDPVAVEEATRGLVALEAQERDRCAKFAKLAIDAGIEERRVRLAEREVDMMEAVIRRALDGLGLTAEQAARAPAVIAQAIRLTAIGGAA